MPPRRGWDDYPPPLPDGECLIWQGPVHSQGYGRVGSRQYAHRVAYERERGPIPKGHQIDHTCRVRLCVFIGHLEAVSQTENIRRQPNVIRQMQATECPHGHPYDEQNTWLRKRGNGWKRECRRCHNDRVTARKRKARAAKKGF